MSVRIRIRRDTEANWTTNNPVLLPGEIGIESDTLKMKVGPLSPSQGTAWNSILTYMNVVPSDLNSTLNGYVLVEDIGAAGGVVGLNNSLNAIIPGSSIILEGPTADSYETTLTVTDPTADRTITLPDATGTLALTSQLPTQYTDELAQDATAAALAAGTHTNITVTYDDNANSISLAAAPGYVDEQAVDAVAAALAAGTHTNITVTYSDETNAISLTGATTYSDENAQDAVGNAVGTGLSYNDTTGAISVDTAIIQARVADVSDTEIGYLNGVTSAIQTQIDTKAPTNNPTFTGTVTLPGNPGSANEAANKAYVDNIAAGLNFHAAVHAATTANLDATYNNGTAGVGATLTSSSNGSLTVDGHAMLLNERILVKNQTTGSQNGIYVVSTVGDVSNPWVLTRATDADNSPTGEISYGDFCFVQDGTSNGGYGYILNTTGTVTIGTTALSYTQFNTGQSVIAGNGLVEAIPGTFAIDTNVTQTRVANVSDTEIGYLDGVTSSIQTQLNTKASLTGTETLTNKTLTSPTITGTSTISGTGDFVISGTTNIRIAPAGGSEAYVGLANPSNIITTAGNTQTLTNKTLTLPVIDNPKYGYTTTATAAGTTTLTSSSNYMQFFTGSTTQTIVLPAASTMTLGQGFYIENLSTGNLTVNSSGGNLVATVIPGGTMLITCILTSGTTAASWDADWHGFSTITGTGANVLGTAPTISNIVLSGTLNAGGGNGSNNQLLQSTGTGIQWATNINWSSTSVTGNTATTVDTVALSTFTTAKYVVSIKQGSKVRSSEIIAQTDGTSVDYTEFGVVETGGNIYGVLVAASASGSNCLLQVTIADAATTNATVKIHKVLI